MASVQSWALNRVGSLRVWEGEGQRAPHKPLLLLWALGHYSRGGTRLIPFADLDEPLRRLLAEFGPPRMVHHTEYPFWHLQTDGIWEVALADEEFERIKRAGYPTKGALLRGEARGGVLAPLYHAVTTDERLLTELVQGLLEPAFPASVTEDLLDAVGLNLTGARRRRDPSFRNRVLTVYEYRCAICGFDARLGAAPAGLEAAHIRWYQAGGPDSEQNGLALCTLHHKLLDMGGLTVSRDGNILVSEILHGTGNFSELVLAYHGFPIRTPVNPGYRPAVAYLEWHWEQVFRGPPRP